MRRKKRKLERRVSASNDSRANLSEEAACLSKKAHMSPPYRLSDTGEPKIRKSTNWPSHATPLAAENAGAVKTLVGFARSDTAFSSKVGGRGTDVASMGKVTIKKFSMGRDSAHAHSRKASNTKERVKAERRMTDRL